MEAVFSNHTSKNLRAYIQTYLKRLLTQKMVVKIDRGHRDVAYWCPEDKLADLRKYFDNIMAPTSFIDVLKNTMRQRMVADEYVTVGMILDWIDAMYPKCKKPAQPFKYTQYCLRQMVNQNVLFQGTHNYNTIVYWCPKNKLDGLFKFLDGSPNTKPKASVAQRSQIEKAKPKATEAEAAKPKAIFLATKRYLVEKFVALNAGGIQVKWKNYANPTWADPIDLLNDIGPDAMATLIGALPEKKVQKVTVKQDDGNTWTAIPIGPEGAETRTVFSKATATFYYDIDNDMVFDS